MNSLVRVLVHVAHVVLSCPAGNHRDTLDGRRGYLAYRCTDCGRVHLIGGVYSHATNKKIKGWSA